jgi:hypothetical protein
MLVLLTEKPPPSIAAAIEELVKQTFRLLKINDYPEKDWDGDKVNIKAQMPLWVEKLYASSPSNAPVVDFFRFYYRWLFDYEDGYGCGFYIENFRDILYVKSDFLQPYADEIFRGAFDLSTYPELKDNFRKFYLFHDRDYLRLRGTQDGICYLLKTLFGATIATAVTTSPTSIQITSNVSSSYESIITELGCPFGFNVTFVYV